MQKVKSQNTKAKSQINNNIGILAEIYENI